MDDEYFRHNRDKLPLPNQMQLSKKPRKLCCIFIRVLESTLNLYILKKKKKKEPHSLNISEIIASERRGYSDV